VLATSSNWGEDWTEPEMINGRLSYHEYDPFLCTTAGQTTTYIHCFLGIPDYPDGYGIYYIRNKPFYSDRMPIPPAAPGILKIRASPNVFNSSTLISYENSEGADAQIEIYNVLGQKVWSKSIYGKEGNIIWDAKDINGNGISSGVYFVRAISKLSMGTEKILYLK
jgi:hypothetical protein